MSQYPQGIFQTLTWLVKQVKLLQWKIDRRSYKVYTALLTQGGAEGPVDIESGNLIIGVTYRIIVNNGGGNFTNVGAPNNIAGTFFMATGTNPTTWGNPGEAALEYNTAAPVATVLENTIGDVWFNYSTNGRYFLNSAALFTGTIPLIVTPMGFEGEINFDESWGSYYGVRKIDSSQIIIETGIPNYGRQDDKLFNQFIEIRMYN